LAVARHYEALGDEELAGALASHYVAAHEASEEGPEAEAVAAQARLALAAAAQRAAALGAHQQAISHIEQALAIAGSPEERAPLLDRAAISATAAALPDAQAYASAAVDAYRAIGDAPAAVAAQVRLGRVLLDASELERAVELLEGIIPEAEAIDRPEILARVQANLSRGLMRRAETRRAIEAADRALDLSEVRNLDDVTAEALLNKGAALSQLGRAHEAIALESAALDLSHGVADTAFQFRVRNNLASALSDLDPVGSARILDEAAQLARDVGDLGMYAWLLGNVAAARWQEGRGWQEVLDELSETLERLTLPTDRVRTLTFMTLIRESMGQEGYLEQMRAVAGDEPGVEMRFALLMAESYRRVVRGDPAGGYEWASQAAELHPSNPEVPAKAMLSAAILARDPDLIRASAAAVDALPLAGRWTQNDRVFASAAVAAIEGRTTEAASGFRMAHEGYVNLGLHYDAAQSLVQALTLLPGHPELLPLVPEARSLLESLDARPWLAMLDGVTARPSGAVAAPSAIPTADERVPG
jgi:tetratricopeptide (TPR) repeat protein